MISAVRTVHKEKEESLGGIVLLAVMGISLGYQAKSTRYLIIYFYPFPCGFWMLSLILEFPEIGPGFSLLWYCAAVAATHPVGVIGFTYKEGSC